MDPIVWTKAKYLEPKTRGRYKGGSNSSSTKKPKRVGGRAAAVKPVLDWEPVMILDFRDGRKGKITWTSRKKSAK